MRGRLARLFCAAALGWAVLAWSGSAWAELPPSAQTPDPSPARDSVATDVCRVIAAAAAKHDLPVAFLTRLIWRESSFRPHVTSRAGAQGIAQFMPGTAAERGLSDPFDPEEAIPASAGYLKALREQFGNLGLAAAAYNAGPGRVARWRQSGGYLPLETENYVIFVTGHPADAWAGREGAAVPEYKPREADCPTMVASIRRGAPSLIEGVYAPFGVQLAGNFSKARAIATYQREVARFPALLQGKPTLILGRAVAGRGRRAFYRVRLPAQTLKEAGLFCDRLRRAGGNCAVLRN